MIIVVGCWLGNEERIKTLISSRPISDGLFGEQFSEQLVRDGISDLLMLLIISIHC